LGNYIIQWTWRGYYDVVDVEVVAGTASVSLPYGSSPPVQPANTPSQYKRVDHCTFLNYTVAGYCQRMLTDAKGCQQECDRNTFFGCNAVQILPAVYPPTVYSRFLTQTLIPNATQCNAKNLMSGATFANKVCFSLQMMIPVPLLPNPQYIITNDPEDPAFYSTCLFRVQPSGLNTSTAAAPRQADFQFEHRCTDCAEAISSTYEQYIPTWNVSNTCVNCPVDGVKATSVPVPTNWSAVTEPFISFPGAKCWQYFETGWPGTCGANASSVPCSIQLTPPGTNGQADLTLTDCYLLAKANPKCDSRMVWKTNAYQSDPGICQCWQNGTLATACCGACVAYGKSNYYQMIQLEKQPPF